MSEVNSCLVVATWEARGIQTVKGVDLTKRFVNSRWTTAGIFNTHYFNLTVQFERKSRGIYKKIMSPLSAVDWIIVCKAFRMSRICNSSGEYPIAHRHLWLDPHWWMNCRWFFENRVEIFRNSNRTCFFKNNKNPPRLNHKPRAGRVH